MKEFPSEINVFFSNLTSKYAKKSHVDDFQWDQDNCKQLPNFNMNLYYHI